MESVQIKKHPPYKEAVDKILKRFDEEGYGSFFSDEEIDEILSITPPLSPCTVEEHEKYQLSRLQIYETIKLLLKDHDLCLWHDRGSDGFIIAHPNDQISVIADNRKAKVKKEIRTYILTLRNTNVTMLSDENKTKRNDELSKIEWFRRGINKRKFEQIEN